MSSGDSNDWCHVAQSRCGDARRVGSFQVSKPHQGIATSFDVLRFQKLTLTLKFALYRRELFIALLAYRMPGRNFAGSKNRREQKQRSRPKEQRPDITNHTRT